MSPIRHTLKDVKYYSKLAKVQANRAYNRVKNFPGGFGEMPSEITLHVNARCNLRCVMCDYWKQNPTDDLSLEDWKNILLGLKRWLGSFFVTVTGGEPLLRSDLDELLRFISALGLPCNLVTNGTLLSEERCRQLVATGVDSVALSLDGMGETYAAVRGKDLFSQVEKTALFLKQQGLRVHVTTVVMAENHKNLPDLVCWVKENGLDSIK